MATTKLDCLFLKPNNLAITSAATKEMIVWITKMTGITARSASLSAVNCEASLMKTGA